jgi:hypothetical protein
MSIICGTTQHSNNVRRQVSCVASSAEKLSHAEKRGNREENRKVGGEVVEGSVATHREGRRERGYGDG